MMIFCPMNVVIDMMKQWSPSGLRPVTIQSFLRRVISRSAVEMTAARDSPSSSRTAYLSMSDMMMIVVMMIVMMVVMMMMMMIAV